MFRAAVLVLAVSSLAVTPQAPQTTIRVSADFVEVDAFVTDSSGRFVRGLQKADFTVFEDGKRVDVATLELIDLPPATGSTGSSPAISLTDVSTNAAAANGRLYFLVLDDLQTPPELSGPARRLAKQFLERNMAPGDLVSILTTSGRQERSQDFTDNRRTLEAVIDSFVGQKVPGATVATYGGGAPVVANAGENSPGERERFWLARAGLETLNRVAAYAAALHGRRKALVLVSTGMDVDFGASTTPQELKAEIRALTMNAAKANLSIYPLDPSGLTGGGDDAVLLTGKGASQTGLQDERRAATDGLKMLAQQTGGAAFVDTSNFDRAFTSIDNANSTYYMLTYRSRAPADGRFHKIEVRAARTGVSVRARNGYVKPLPGSLASPAATDLPSEDLRTALADPRPSRGVTLQATAVSFRGDGARASVVILVHVAGSSLTFEPSAEKMRSEIELALAAIDPKAHALGGERATITMELAPQNHERALREGVVLPVRLELPPGRCQVRIGVKDAKTDRLGTLRYDLDVPDYGRSTAAFSTLFAITSEEQPFARDDAALKQLFGKYPTLSRTFDASGVLQVAGIVYPPDGSAARPASAQLLQNDRVISTRDLRTVAASVAAPGILLVADVPLTELQPGTYAVRFVTGDAQRSMAESRPFVFSVR